MTPEQFAAARRRLGMSQVELADALGLAGTRAQAAYRIREMEAGGREVSGPIARVIEALEAGWRPGDRDAEVVTRIARRVHGANQGLLAEAALMKQRAFAHADAGENEDAAEEANKATGIAHAVNVIGLAILEFLP